MSGCPRCFLRTVRVATFYAVFYVLVGAVLASIYQSVGLVIANGNGRNPPSDVDLTHFPALLVFPHPKSQRLFHLRLRPNASGNGGNGYLNLFTQGDPWYYPNALGAFYEHLLTQGKGEDRGAARPPACNATDLAAPRLLLPPCPFDLEDLGECGPREVPFGYDVQNDAVSPCFAITLSRIVGYVPVPVRHYPDVAKFRTDLPPSLTTVVADPTLHAKVHVTCAVKNASDPFSVPDLVYYPSDQGFHMGHFPFLGEETHVDRPIVALKVVNLQRHQRITVACSALHDGTVPIQHTEFDVLFD